MCCGEGHRERLQVVGRIVVGAAVFFDCQEQFAHRTHEAVIEPQPLKSRLCDAVWCCEGDGLRAEVGAIRYD